MQGGTVAVAADAATRSYPVVALAEFAVPTASASPPSAACQPGSSHQPDPMGPAAGSDEHDAPRLAGMPQPRRRMALGVKSIVDKTLAVLGLAALLPLLATVALAIRLTSRGPALFHQTRIGRDGNPFTMLKFRTMRVGAERELRTLLDRNESDGGVLFKMRADPRVTPVGRWLRRLSLDELPQLMNVLRGSMSLVGPRPPLPSEVARYSADARRRLLVKPGLTGLWQVSGRSNLTWEDSLRLDLRYVDDWSLKLDTVVLIKTVGAVLRADGAY